MVHVMDSAKTASPRPRRPILAKWLPRVLLLFLALALIDVNVVGLMFSWPTNVQGCPQVDDFCGSLPLTIVIVLDLLLATAGAVLGLMGRVRLSALILAASLVPTLYLLFLSDV